LQKKKGIEKLWEKKKRKREGDRREAEPVLPLHEKRGHGPGGGGKSKNFTEEGRKLSIQGK